MRPGYYRDYDSWLFLTSAGDVYEVDTPGATEPVWRKVGPSLGDDAKPGTPDAEDLARFERTRVAYGIPE